MIWMADNRRRYSFEFIDDPELDISTARILDENFIIDGKIDRGQACGLYSVEFGGGPLARRKARRRFMKSTAELPVPIRLVVPCAHDFEIRDRAQIGITIPERFEYKRDRVEIIGLMECDITVWVRSSSAAYFELGQLEASTPGK